MHFTGNIRSRTSHSAGVRAGNSLGLATTSMSPRQIARHKTRFRDQEFASGRYKGRGQVSQVSRDRGCGLGDESVEVAVEFGLQDVCGDGGFGLGPGKNGAGDVGVGAFEGGDVFF